MTYVRRNAWDKGGTFANTDLLWYAQGVGAMQSRSLDNPTSWWFYAAMHGQHLTDNLPGYPNWSFIPSPPTVKTSPLPSQALIDRFWNQCQHQSWYFLPWHRGYLIAIETILRDIIKGLGGPWQTWALPFWNYFKPGENAIPPAFTQQTMPAGGINPLFVKNRFGPNGDGNIYVPMAKVTQVCQDNTIYTGSDARTPLPGYGGPKTGFWHGGRRYSSGNIEANPHNLVHSYVGGVSNQTHEDGLMGKGGTSALDPIFYLHHCNIDRMWAEWNAKGNSNPTDPDWVKGPAANGEREFAMPLEGGTVLVFHPGMVSNISTWNYEYKDLSTDVAPQFENKLVQRLNKLGVTSSADDIKKIETMDIGGNTELIGANDGALQINSSGTSTTVQLDSIAWKKIPTSFMKASTTNLPDRVYLQLENVQGTMEANVLAVSVNQKHAGYLSLFGLEMASAKDGHEGGAGLTLLLDITDIIDDLHVDNNLDIGSLDVTIVPENAIPDSKKITVERVSVYREALS